MPEALISVPSVVARPSTAMTRCRRRAESACRPCRIAVVRGLGCVCGYGVAGHAVASVRVRWWRWRAAGMPRWTARCRRITATASSIAARSTSLALVEVAVDAGDEPPDPGDLLLGGGGVGAGPVVDAVDGRGQSFAGAEQVVEVGGQVGQVGHVGAEVVAAGAAEPDRAGAAAGLHVGRFGAAPVGDGDLADGVAGVFGVQQGGGVAARSGCRAGRNSSR